LHAVNANHQHGKPRSNRDKRRATQILLGDEQWQKWSDTIIARECGVSQRFVSGMREELRTVLGCEQPAATVGADGKTRKRPVKKRAGESDESDLSDQSDESDLSDQSDTSDAPDAPDVPEPDPDFPDASAQFRERLETWAGMQMDNINGLTWQLAAAVAWGCSEAWVKRSRKHGS
jgi:hypothetical protein